MHVTMYSSLLAMVCQIRTVHRYAMLPIKSAPSVYSRTMVNYRLTISRLDTSYLPQLVPYNSLHQKITLVQGAGFETDFYQLGLPIAQFPTVFRWSELAPAPSTTKGSSTTRTSSSTKAPAPARDVPALSALDRDDWRHSSVGADGISYDSNGIIVSVPDFTSDSFFSKPGMKKVKPCKYFQKVSYEKFLQKPAELIQSGLLPLG
jgi:hypothetical protein